MGNGKTEKLERREGKEAVRSSESERILGEYYSAKIGLANPDKPTPSELEELRKLKKEWKKNDRSTISDFDAAFANYKKKIEAPNAAPNGAPNVIVANPSAEKLLTLPEFTDAMKKFVDDSLTPLQIAESLVENGLTPSDLLGGAGQIAAIEVAFAGNPALRNKLLDVVRNGKSDPGYELAINQLNDMSALVQENFEMERGLKKSHEQFSEDMVGDFISEKLGSLKDSIKKNPIMTLAALTTVLVVGKMVYSNLLPEKVKTTVKVAGLGLVSAWGVNVLSGVMSKDGKTLLDRALFNPDTFEYEPVMRRMKNDIDRMSDGNKHAFQALMHLGHARASTVASAFESAFRGNKEEIDPYAIFSARDITAEDAKMIQPAGMYKGLEGLMLEIAHKNGIPKGQNDSLAVETGLRIFKEKYASGGRDFLMYSAIANHIGEPAGAFDSDGFRSKDDPEYVESSYQTPEGLKLQNDLEKVFSKVVVTAEIFGTDTGEVNIDSYPFNVTVDDTEDKKDKIYTFEDKIKGGKFEIDTSKATTNDVQAISDYVKVKIYERFLDTLDQSKYAPMLAGGPVLPILEFDRTKPKDERKWYIVPPMTLNDFAGINPAGTGAGTGALPEVPMYIEPSAEKDEVVVRRPGTKESFHTYDEARESKEDTLVIEALNRDLTFILDGVDYEIMKKDYDAGADTGRFTIEYKKDSFLSKLGRTITGYSEYADKAARLTGFTGKETAEVVYQSGKLVSQSGLFEIATAKMEARMIETFADISGMEWSPGVSTQFEAFSEIYMSRIKGELSSELMALPVTADLDNKVHDVFEKWERKSQALWVAKGATQSEQQIREIERVMNRNMLTNPDTWADPSFQFAEFLKGHYSFDKWNKLFVKNPWIFKSYMGVYYEKINYGDNTASKGAAEKYQEYFNSRFENLVSNDANWSIDSLWKKFAGGDMVIEESSLDWEQHIALVRQIDSYDEWKKRPEIRDQVEFLDVEGKEDERIEENMDAVEQEFMDKVWDKGYLWDTGIVHREWFRKESGWLNRYKGLIDMRAQKARENCKDIVDFKKKLNRIAKMSAMEAQIMDRLMGEWVPEGQYSAEWYKIPFLNSSTIGDVVFNTFNKDFDAFYRSRSEKYTDYGDQLAKDLESKIRDAELFNRFSIVNGVWTVPGPDPLGVL